jgi:DNA-binding MarR family transcriptional regulator
MKENKKYISELSRSLIDIVWYFGPKGLDGACCENLSMPEFLALDTVVMTPDCPVHEIGKTLGFTKSGATRIVNRLEKKGYVNKMTGSDDARICCVHITEKGKAFIRNTDKLYREKLGQLLKRMPDDTSQRAKELLIAMAKASIR